MSSIITAIFKATIGLLVSKGRDKAVEKLKDGDVTDQRLRGLIVREIDDIKSKLNGLARKDLLASISFFKEGIELLYEVFDKTTLARRECSEAVTAGTASGEAVALAQGMRKLELTAGLDESASRALVNAKKRFKRAREKGTEAFANEALELSDRMLAMQYRVMATILETLDHPEDALAACRVCIEELHSLSAVKECFSIELKKGFRARISKGERRAFISTVCHVNRVVYNVTLMVATHIEVFLLPYIEIGEEKVDPLRDSRVGKVLHKVGMEHCCVTPWSFGQEGEEQHKVKRPTAMVTNADGQFIIADSWDKTVKVFDNSGRFLLVFCPQPDDDGTKFVVAILDVATDANSNIYALVRLQETGAEREEMRWSCHVLVHSSAGDQLRKFHVRMKGGCGRLTVGKTKVLVAWGRVIDVFELDGEYVCSFGDEMMEVTDCTAGPDGQVLVLDSGGSCVYVFTEDGQQQSKFRIRTEEADRHVHYDRFVWHQGSELVIAACVERGTKRLRVVMFTKVGKYHRTMNLDEKAYAYTVDGITVSVEGGIALAFTGHDENGKIIIVR